ncbi:MAG: hypothetical protein RIE58_07045 [Vicingaceae bacterium]
MVDGIKIFIQLIDSQQILEHHDLRFNFSVDSETDEITKYQAKYKHLRFTLFQPSKVLIITGSIHYYKNDGHHNHDDFSHEDLKQTLRKFESEFNIELDDCFIQNIEFGMNIHPPIDTGEILNGLMYHWGSRFKELDKRGSDYRQADHQRKKFKIYDKSQQFNLPYDLLRIEVKYTKMQDLKKLQIVTLKDLLGDHWVTSTKEMLLREWDKTIYYDQSIETNVPQTPHKLKKMKQWSSPSFWENLTSQARFNENRIYKQTLKKYSEDVKGQIREEMERKWNEMSNKHVHINRHIRQYTPIIFNDKLTTWV